MFCLSNQKGLTYSDILTLHRIFAFLLTNKLPGSIRDCTVKIVGHVSDITSYFCPPSNVESRLIKVIANMQEHDKNRDVSIFKKAWRLHTWLVNIHPFKDGNGRVFRLALNTYLLQNGYAPVNFKENERERYLTLMDRISNNLDVNMKECFSYGNGKKTANYSFFDMIEDAKKLALTEFLEYYKTL